MLYRIAVLAGVVTFVAALSTGLVYVESVFATVMPPDVAGWHATAAAVATEAGVVFAGLVVALRSRDGDRNLRLYAAMLLFVLVSLFANGDAVLRAMIGERPTLDAIRALDAWSLARAVLLGSAVPLMVLVALEALRELAQTSPAGALPAVAVSAHREALSSGSDAPRLPGKAQRRGSPEDLVQIIERDPTVTVADAARLLGVSRPTVYRWAETAGAERDEDGVWQT